MKKTDSKVQKQQSRKPSETKSSKSTTWIWLILASLSILTFAIYSFSTKCGYVWDDGLYITKNNDIQNIHWENIKLFFSSFYAGNYQPISMLFYAVENKLSLDPISLFHIDNILIHILNSLLVFVVIRKLSPANVWVAIITAAFFAVHPMHVESVIWISERKDVLYTFFFLLSLVFYCDYLKTSKIHFLLIAGIFFVLSCFSKSAAVILPVVFVLFDYYTNRSFHWKMIVEKLPFFAISLVFGIVAVHSQKNSGSIQEMAPTMSMLEHISIVSFSTLSYLFKAFFPIKLSILYPYPIEIGKTLPLYYYLAIPILCLLLFFVWYSLKWGKDILFGFLFFLVTIILVLQVIPVGAASMADRYSYVPYIGLFFIVGKIVDWLWNKEKLKKQYKQIAIIVLSLGFVSFAGITQKRVKVWENEETLFSDAIDKYPQCNFPYFVRASNYIDVYVDGIYAQDSTNRRMYINKALSDYKNALIYTINPQRKADVLYSIGYSYAKLNDFVHAVDYYNQSIKVSPQGSTAYLNRGSCYLDYYANIIFANNKTEHEKYMKLAQKDFENVIRYTDKIDDRAKAYFDLALVLFNLQDNVGAVKYNSEAIAIYPDYADAYNDRGCAKFNMKDYKGALDDYNKVLELNPQDANALKNRNLVQSILDSKK